MSEKADYVQAIRGDGAPDLDALRELSQEDYEDEFGEGSKGSSDGVIADDDDEGPILKPEPKEEPKEAEEEDSEEEEKESDDEEEAEEEEKEAAPVDDEDAIVAKGPNGAEIKVPREAVFEVTVNGQKVEMTLEEIRNRASGDLHIHQETSRLGRERQDLETKKAEWQKQIAAAEENLEILANASPEEFFHHYAMMTNQSPAQVSRDFMEKALKHAAEFERMTPEQRALKDEAARVGLERRRIEKERSALEAHREQQRQLQEVDQLLNSQGVGWDEFEVATKFLAENAPANAHITPEVVVEQVFILRHYNKVVDAVRTVDENVLRDGNRLQQVYDSLARAESISRRAYTAAETQEFVREALGVKKKPSLSESLSTKVARAEQTGRTNSKTASSRKRKEEDSYADTLTLAEHRERISQLD